LAVELAALFPPGAIAAQVTEPVDRGILTPTELALMVRCAPKRLVDFTAGRACARRCLLELGFGDFSVLAGSQREPLWPPAIVGSITHTSGYGAAVVARETDIRSLGLDCEVVDDVGEDLWGRICTSAELELLADLEPSQRRRRAALIFAAKEAFYKCQFPSTQQWVGFEEVRIEALPGGADSGSVRIRPEKPLPWDDRTMDSLQGRFRFSQGKVIVGVARL
jgi:enterobactin synthetase component D / holo-[acyl-carrier protein] synthase